MGDSEKFSNKTPDLQDAIRSIESTGEDFGAISGQGPASQAEPDGEPGTPSAKTETDSSSGAGTETETNQ
jgi:hypothetical protein